MLKICVEGNSAYSVDNNYQFIKNVIQVLVIMKQYYKLRIHTHRDINVNIAGSALLLLQFQKIISTILSYLESKNCLTAVIAKNK